MSNKDEITAIKKPVQLNYAEINLQKLIESSQKISNIMDSLRIQDANFMNGDYYDNNTNNKIKTFVTKGIILKENENTYNITIVKGDYDEKGVIYELENTNTQKMIGAFLDKSQSWVSNKNQYII